MNYSTLKWLTILLPPALIGGFEYVRHDLLLGFMSMERGNLYTTVLALLLSYWFAAWLFRRMDRINARLSAEQARLAVLEERERLAEELHDNIAQTLFFLNVKLQKGQVEEARQALNDIGLQVRHAIFNLRSQPDEGADLGSRLKNWVSEWSLLSGIETEVAVEMEEGFFSPQQEIQLFAVTQEAFTNIRKHSGGDRAELSLYAGGREWQLVISDNGKGPVGSQAHQTGTYGLAMIKKRSEELGAELICERGKSGGFELRLSGTRRGGFI